MRRFKHGRNVINFKLNDNEIGALRTAYRTLVFRYPNAAGFNKFTCTPNHTIFTPDRRNQRRGPDDRGQDPGPAQRR